MYSCGTAAYRLTPEELADLRAAHRRAQDVHAAYRINAVILLGRGRAVADVADALLFDPETVRQYFKKCSDGGVEQLVRMSDVGSDALLDCGQLGELDARLRERLHPSAQSVVGWV